MHTASLFLMGLSLLAPSADAEPKPLALVTVDAGPHDRQDAVIVASVYPKMRLGKELTPAQLATSRLELLEQDSPTPAKPIPAQWQAPTTPPLSSFEHGALVFVLPGRMKAQTRRRFLLQRNPKPTPPSPMSIEDDTGKALLIRHAGRPVAKYNYGLVRRRAGRESIFDRTAYFHPVWAPGGQIVTDDFPKSHPHQRGIFLAWTRVTIDGYKADFWNLGDQRGKTVHERMEGVVSGPVFAGFTAHNNCVANERVAVEETWVTRAYALPKGPWILDFDVRHTATDKAVSLEKYRYGGMAYRGRPEWVGSDRPEILTSEKYNPRTVGPESARWIDMAGKLPGGKAGGVMLIDHPSNPHFPTAGRIHPALPYFCLAFMRRAGYKIEAGSSLELRYRCVVHDGPPDRETNERLFRDFADPPRVSLTPVKEGK